MKKHLLLKLLLILAAVLFPLCILFFPPLQWLNTPVVWVLYGISLLALLSLCGKRSRDLPNSLSPDAAQQLEEAKAAADRRSCCQRL